MSRSPLYERVESVLAGDIADGSLPPETQLPPEDGLVERFKVSRTTVRKAIQNLVERGLVEVRRGKGTFVTQPKITQELTELTGFVEDMRAVGRTPAAWLLDKRIVAADETVAHQLALAPGTLVVASACSLGRRCGDVFRRDILASRDRGKSCGGRP
jgi:GntR family transcriptional regulator